MTALALYALVFAQGQAAPKELPSGPEKYGYLGYSFSPDSKQIIFSRIDDTSKRPFSQDSVHTWIADADGANPQMIMTGTPGAVFTRDGKRLVYTKKNDLYAYDLATKTETKLNVNLQANSVIASPTEDKLVFSATLFLIPPTQGQPRQGEMQIFTCNLDGTDVRQLTVGAGFAYNPIWSLDGKQIVFYRELGDRKDQIYTMNADGTGLKHLSDSSRHNFYPAFGPNGCVSYTQPIKEDNNIVVLADADGKIQGTFPYKTFRVIWSPDGRKAIFSVGNFESGLSLYVCDADGSNLKRIGQP